MKSYKYVQLELGGYGIIHLYPTDSQMLDWILGVEKGHNKLSDVRR